MATGIKEWVVGSPSYFEIFLCSAKAATSPAAMVAWLMYDGD